VTDQSHKFYQGHLLKFTEWAVDDIITIMKETKGLANESGLVENGALKLYFDTASFQEAKKNNRWSSNPDGEETVMLSKDELLALEPSLAHMEAGTTGGGSEQLVGAALQTKAASGSCLGYTTGVMKVLKEKHRSRFRVESNISVVDFETEMGNITQMHTSRGTLDVPRDVDVVVTAGSWTPVILRKLNLYCPVYPMKG
jgi:glycine/D-amino acid oxidase-like deaminating enzyme